LAGKRFKEIIRKYPGTQTALEINMARSAQAREMKKLYKEALDQFRLDNGRYPTSDEGLDILLKNKFDLPKWDGPYLVNDKYNNKFIYISNGSEYTIEIKGFFD
jgi:general secretion pathway protein G